MMDAPNLYGWGSFTWTSRMIKNPGDDRHYGFLEKKDQMPAFVGQLNESDLRTIIRRLKGDYLAEGSSARGAKPAAPAQ